MKGKTKKISSPGGLEPPTFRLTAERANRLRHGDLLNSKGEILNFKPNDFFHYVIVPISFPDSLFFTSYSFPIFFIFPCPFTYCRAAQICYFPIQDSGKRKSVDGNFNRIWLLLVLAGKRDSPKFGHGMQDFFSLSAGKSRRLKCTLYPPKQNTYWAGWRY